MCLRNVTYQESAETHIEVKWIRRKSDEQRKKNTNEPNAKRQKKMKWKCRTRCELPPYQSKCITLVFYSRRHRKSQNSYLPSNIMRVCVGHTVHAHIPTKKNPSQIKTIPKQNQNDPDRCSFIHCCVYYFPLNEYSRHFVGLLFLFAVLSGATLHRQHVWSFIQTETEFGMLTSFFDMNNILAILLEVTILFLILVSDGSSFSFASVLISFVRVFAFVYKIQNVFLPERFEMK